MNIWIFFIGETLPIDEKKRLWRYGTLADELVSRGHNVVHWVPSFNHAEKRQRSQNDKVICLDGNYSLRLLYVKGYEKNISLRRILFNKLLGQAFLRNAMQETEAYLGMAVHF